MCSLLNDLRLDLSVTEDMEARLQRVKKTTLQYYYICFRLHCTDEKQMKISILLIF